MYVCLTKNGVITNVSIADEDFDFVLNSEFKKLPNGKWIGDVFEDTTIPSNQELAAENKLLKAQLAAVSDRNDFMEECIAEMATLVYTV